MLLRTLIAPLVVTLGISGCSLLPAAGNLPSHKDLDEYPAALLSAELVVEGECLFADNAQSGGRWLPIWPNGFALANGVIRDERGPVAAVGDTVKLGGGEYHHTQFDFLQTMLVVPVPSSCRGGDYWLVSDVTQ